MAVISLMGLIPLALMEEFAFRQVPLQRLLQRFDRNKNGWWIIVLTSIAFGLYHITSLQNFGSRFTGPFLWGFVFSLAFIWSGTLSFPTGIHVALNAGQSLLGLKATKESLFEVVAAPGAKGAMQAIETVGFLTTLVPAAIALVLILQFFKKNSSYKEFVK